MAMSRTKRQSKSSVVKPGELMTPRARHLLKKFGITVEQYETLLHRQGHCCAVCKRPASEFKHRLAVDHDHKTGYIRGIICTYCNRWIVGRHRRESGADLLLRAYKYLTADYPGWIVPPKIKKKRRGKTRHTH